MKKKRYKLYKHQEKAINLVLKHKHFPLFMDMGTGKTPTIVRLAEKLYKEQGITRVMIVVPKNLIYNWMREINRFQNLKRKEYIIESLDQRSKAQRHEAYIDFLKEDLNNLTLKELKAQGHKGKKSDIIDSISTPRLQILLVNYEKSRVMFKEIRKFKPQVLVVDEIHKLKNPDAAISKKVLQLTRGCEYRIGMTGTPMSNGWEDIFMPYNIIYGSESPFGTKFKDFREEHMIIRNYKGYPEIMGYVDEDLLEKVVKDTSYLVKLEDCIDLPKQLDDLYITYELEPKAAKLYRDMDKEMVAILDEVSQELSRNELKKLLKANDIRINKRDSYRQLLFKAADLLENVASAELAITKALRLQQITGGFVKAEDGTIRQVSKAGINTVVDFVKDYHEPIIIFCKYLPEIEGLQKELAKIKKNKKSLKIRTYHGKTKNKDKINLDFQAGKIDVLILQISAGSVGLNLQRASKVMFYSQTASYEEFKQAVARILRNGQKKRCQVIHVMCEIENSIDFHILETIRSKAKRAERLR